MASEVKKYGLFWAVIGLLFSNTCFAQATANFTASVTIIQPVSITTASHMDFANLDAGSGGEVILTAGSTRIPSGGLKLEEGGLVSAASFEVTGQEGYTFSINLPEGQHVLSNGRETIKIKDFTSDIDGTGLLVRGSQKINVGATLVVNPNQTPGTYLSQGPMNVTVNYN